MDFGRGGAGGLGAFGAGIVWSVRIGYFRLQQNMRDVQVGVGGVRNTWVSS